MKLYSTTLEEMTRNANLATLALANTLQDAGVISKEQFTTMTENFAVIVAEQGFFGRHLDKVMGWNDNKMMYFKCVQINNIKYNNKETDVYQSEDSDREGLDKRPN